MNSSGGVTDASPRANGVVLFGIALVTLSTLVLQIGITRVFSAVLWYHFAFLAISVALFGSGAAGQWVYLSKRGIDSEHILQRLQNSALAYSVAVPLAFLAFSQQIVLTDWLEPIGMHEIGRWTLTYVVFAVPFFFAGTCVALALAAFKDDVSRLYSFDLFGAGLGCLAVVPLLSWFGGPGTLQAVAVIAALAALLFGWDGSGSRKAMTAGVLVLMVLLIPVMTTIEIPTLIHKAYMPPKELEQWNASSRVAVHEATVGAPVLWGLGENVEELPKVEHRIISIDAYAGTPMLRYDGDLDKLSFLNLDVSSLGYEIFPEGGTALVIGAGGGRDVLTALIAGASRVHAVEINALVMGLAREQFADFTGHLYEDPRVLPVVDEGRSYVAKLDERVDLIQASMVDTAAASAAGAFSLTENNLYTIEAFEQYYDHLTDNGTVTLTRAFPSESLRLFGIAMLAWQNKGVEHPEDHIFVINSVDKRWFPLANFIIKRDPLTPEEIAVLENSAKEKGFAVAYKPGGGDEAYFDEIVAAPDINEYAARFPIDITPNTDDSPFFFNFVRISDVLRGDGAYIPLSVADNATVVLLRVLGIVTALAVIFILGPFAVRRRLPIAALKTAPYLLFFTCLGFGFILVELPLVHRFILFLGHPIYALTVVLFSLLVFSGLGSASTQRTEAGMEAPALSRAIVWLIVVLGISVFAFPPILRAFVGLGTPIKVVLSVLMIAPLGFVLGRPFPLGIRMVHGHVTELVPWVWGVNGAASVLGTVVSTVVAISYGFTVALLVGLTFYLIALAVSRGLLSRAG